jgi:hypothetical protein
MTANVPNSINPRTSATNLPTRATTCSVSAMTMSCRVTASHSHSTLAPHLPGMFSVYAIDRSSSATARSVYAIDQLSSAKRWSVSAIDHSLFCDEGYARSHDQLLLCNCELMFALLRLTGATSPQGCVEEWFAPNAWGGTNYSNTPVGAVSHVEGPGFAINGPTYMSLWETGFLLSECAWASKIGFSDAIQVIGDPLIRQ